MQWTTEKVKKKKRHNTRTFLFVAFYSYRVLRVLLLMKLRMKEDRCQKAAPFVLVWKKNGSHKNISLEL